MSHPNFTQPKKAPFPMTTNEQLLLGLIIALKMLFVSLSLVVLFVVLFVRGFLALGMVLLSAGNCFLCWMIRLVASVDEVKAFALFLVAATR